MPLRCSLKTILSARDPTTNTTASMLCRRMVSRRSSELVDLFDLMLGIDGADVERIAAGGRAQDGARGTGKVPHALTRKADQTTAGIALRKQEPFEAVRMPTTSQPSSLAASTVPAMTALSPGT